MDRAHERVFSVLSNEIARLTYQPAFEALAQTEGGLAAADLARLDLGDAPAPVLLSGSCDYTRLASTPQTLDPAKFTTAVKPSLYLVVPEQPTLIGLHQAGGAELTQGVNGLQASLAGVDEPVVLAHFQLKFLHSVGELVRLYDSHLSVYAYAQIADLLARTLGLRAPGALPLHQQSFLCDLAGRFSSTPVSTVFYSEEHLKNEVVGATNRGMVRTFRNEASTSSATLLLLGDSHCYRALAQLFSFIFREVSFYWTGRFENYGAHAEEIERLSREADFFIEESTERFFLYNYCRPA